MDEERLIVSLEARIRDFEKNMAKAERRGSNTYRGLAHRSKSATTAMERDMIGATGRINQALASTSSRIGSFGKAFAGTAVAVGMAAITRGAVQAVGAVADLDRQARRAGVSVEAFQELKFVGEQNRIEVDAMTDGLKELQLRADEFVVTGKGPAAEAFQRLGYRAEDLKRSLEDPKELFLDLIGRMEEFDDAARIRIGDEIFGGTAGERFVELVGRGEGALRSTIQAARDAGIVMDAELIEKAAELDRKFSALQARASAFFKEIVIGIADAGPKVLELGAYLDNLFDGSRNRGVSFLGDDVYDTLSRDARAVEDYRQVIEALASVYDETGYVAERNAARLGRVAEELRAMGQTDAANTLDRVAAEMRTLNSDLEKGTVSAGDFEQRMADVTETAQATLAKVNAIDGVDFGYVIGGLGRLVSALSAAAMKARDLRANLPGARPDGETEAPTYMDPGPSTRNGHRAATPGLAVDESPRPRLPSVDASFGSPEPSTGGSRGRSGSGSRRTESDFEREMSAIKRETEMLELEAKTIAEVAGARFEHGDALEYARKKAELLYEAQKAGIELTPQMIAQIDQLATEYVQAADGVDQIRDRLEAAQEAQEEFRNNIKDTFKDLITGAEDAKDVIGRLVSRIADLALESALSGMFGSVGAGLGGGGGGGGGGLFGGAIIPGILHSGGIAGRDGYGHGRAVASSVFSGAERYHGGGIAGLRANEVPAILERGERVIPNGGSAVAQTGGVLRVVVEEGPMFASRVRTEAEGVSAQVVRNATPAIVKQSVGASQKSFKNTKAGWSP